MELLIAALVNAAADVLWLALLPCGFDFGRTVTAAPAESPLVAESNRDFAAYVAGTMTFAEFTRRNDARLVSLKAKL